LAERFFAYLLHCADGSYYAGHTDNLQLRLLEHENGVGADWTMRRRPVELVWHESFATRDEARAAEATLKRWNRAKKEALIAGDFAVVSRLASRSREGRALRDALLRRAPQERGP
jgi:tRNA/rRNA methyltransferase